MENLSFDQLPQAVGKLIQKVENLESLLLDQTQNKEREDEDKLFTVLEAAQFLNLKTSTIYSKVSRGELPVMKRSKRLYFSKIELLSYLKQGRKLSNSQVDQKVGKYLDPRH